MLIRRVCSVLLICAAALVGVLVGLPSNVPAEDEIEALKLANATTLDAPQSTCGCGVLSMVTIIGPDSSAQERLPDGTVVEFVVPIGTAISTATTTIVFTGRADGTVEGPGNCGLGGQLQSIVAIDPGSGASSFNVIVVRVDGVENPPEVPPGTRLGPLAAIGTCGTSGEYQGLRAVVQ